MKTIYTILLVMLFIPNDILSQVVTGKLVDENGAGLARSATATIHTYECL